MLRAAVVLATSILAVAAVLPAAAQDSPWKGRTVLITGANRGLGLEFARQLQDAGAVVIGTARRPEEAAELSGLGVRVEQLDVTDQASVEALAARLGDLPLDILLNNAGWFGSRGSAAELDPQVALQEYEVNCLGPLRVTQALLPALRRGQAKLVMNMSSGLGSIANNSRGGSPGYRASKAALNMLTATLAAELKDEGFIVVAMSPGWVQTDMGGERAELTPEVSVRGILATLAPLGPTDTGRFLNHDGSGLPW